MFTTDDIAARELDRRSSHGVCVTLIWTPQTDRLFVAVLDEHSGHSFEIEVDADDALDAFRHPYAYADRSDGLALAS